MSSIISCLKENAIRCPNRPAVSDALRTVSYRELWQKAQSAASWLQLQGFANGTKILVEACPDVSFAVFAMGIHLAGCVFVPVEKNVSRQVVTQLTQETEAKLFLGKTDIPYPLSSDQEKIWEMPEGHAIADILFTTGTTGKSKGVILSHRAVFAASDNNRYIDRLAPDSVYLIASPLNHASGLRKMYSCLIAGGHAVLADGFLDVKKYYEMLETHHADTLLLPPSAIRFLLAVSKEKLHSLKNQIKAVHSGSAAMTEAEKDALRLCLPKTRLIFGYGATEAGNACAYDYAEFPGMANCVGKPNPHSTISIADESRQTISSSLENPGYIAISGDTVMTGYLNDPEQTAKVLYKKTLYTNDLGYIDANGFLFVIGRRGDIINCGGLKIAPSEVENAVMQYQGIRECACFGVKDAIAGTAVKLDIVAEDAEHFDMQSFRRFLSTRLESGKIPKNIELVNEIPKTPNGKIDRKRLVREC